jgi:hypothetical protein
MPGPRTPLTGAAAVGETATALAVAKRPPVNLSRPTDETSRYELSSRRVAATPAAVMSLTRGSDDPGLRYLALPQVRRPGSSSLCRATSSPYLIRTADRR